jgi:hypothetical protein
MGKTNLCRGGKLTSRATRLQNNHLCIQLFLRRHNARSASHLILYSTLSAGLARRSPANIYETLRHDLSVTSYGSLLSVGFATLVVQDLDREIEPAHCGPTTRVYNLCRPHQSVCDISSHAVITMIKSKGTRYMIGHSRFDTSMHIHFRKMLLNTHRQSSNCANESPIAWLSNDQSQGSQYRNG